jgi:hypothetical protein
MEYVFIQQETDLPIIINLFKEFKLFSKQELVFRYNKNVRIGIVGSRAQAQMLIALYNAFNFSFGSSPIKIEDNIIISLTGIIQLKGEYWKYSTTKIKS